MAFSEARNSETKSMAWNAWRKSRRGVPAFADD